MVEFWFQVQTYRQLNPNYTNTQPITSVPMSNGMYVMCTNKSSVEQGHVVTGTFYPPVATSQDQQLLGKLNDSFVVSAMLVLPRWFVAGVNQQPTLNTVIANSAAIGNIQYYQPSGMSYYSPKDYSNAYEQHENKDTFIGYSMKPLHQDQTNKQPEYLHHYKTPSPMEDNFSSHHQQHHHHHQQPDFGPPGHQDQLVQTYLKDERSDADSEVDGQEFDKYLKYTDTMVGGGMEGRGIDSNHNYHRNEGGTNMAPPLTYPYQSNHASVILQTAPTAAPIPEVFDQCPKNEDEFSEILAGVRKTCFST